MKNLGEKVIKITLAPLVFLLMMSPFHWANAGTHEMADSIDIVNPGGHAGGAFGQATKLSNIYDVKSISQDVLAALPFYVYKRESRVMKFGSGTYPEGQERLDTFEAIILHGKNKLEDVSYVPYSQRPIGVALKAIKGFDVVEECYDENNNPVDAHYSGTSLIYKAGTPSDRICISLKGIRRNNISKDHLFGYLLPIVLHEVVHRIERTDRANELAEYISNTDNQPETINLNTLKKQWAKRLQGIKRIQYIVDDIINNPNNLCEKYQRFYDSFYSNNSSYIPYLDDNFLMTEPVSNYTYSSIAREIVINSFKVCILSGESPRDFIKPGYVQEGMFYRAYQNNTEEEILEFFKNNTQENMSEYQLDYKSTSALVYKEWQNLPLYKLTTLNFIQTNNDIIKNAKKIKSKLINYLESASEFFGKEYQFVIRAPISELANTFFDYSPYNNANTECSFQITFHSTQMPSESNKNFYIQESRIKSLRNLSSTISLCKDLIMQWNKDSNSYMSRVELISYDEFKSYIVSPKSKGGL